MHTTDAFSKNEFCNRNEKKGTVSVIAFSNPTRNEKGNCIHDIKMCDCEDISKGDLRRLLALYLDNYKKKMYCTW